MGGNRPGLSRINIPVLLTCTGVGPHLHKRFNVFRCPHWIQVPGWHENGGVCPSCHLCRVDGLFKVQGSRPRVCSNKNILTKLQKYFHWQNNMIFCPSHLQIRQVHWDGWQVWRLYQILPNSNKQPKNEFGYYSDSPITSQTSSPISQMLAWNWQNWRKSNYPICLFASLKLQWSVYSITAMKSFFHGNSCKIIDVSQISPTSSPISPTLT